MSFLLLAFRFKYMRCGNKIAEKIERGLLHRRGKDRSRAMKPVAASPNEEKISNSDSTVRGMSYSF